MADPKLAREPELASAAIVLTRSPTTNELLVLLTQRGKHLRNQPEVVVFPGGKVEVADVQATRDEHEALKRCAARECWEETGLLICDSPAVRDRAFEARASSTSFDDALGDASGLELCEMLELCAFVTPPGEADVGRQRFRAVFFVCNLSSSGASSLLPRVAPDRSGEVEYCVWVSPAEALRRQRDSAMAMLPPQFLVLHYLSQFATAEAVCAAIRDSRHPPPTVSPVFAAGAGGAGSEERVFYLNGDEEHDSDPGGVGDRRRLRVDMRRRSGRAQGGAGLWLGVG
mmetsp:Transcript_1345/g.5022  ORF Transcript_1345/g.5022 Transcript_1345/m.5022 type:complete len:286 (-) Transcript_1345:7-864(-)